MICNVTENVYRKEEEFIHFLEVKIFAKIEIYIL